MSIDREVWVPLVFVLLIVATVPVVTGDGGAGDPPVDRDQTVDVTDSVAVWERAALPLRATSEGATQVQNVGTYVEVEAASTGRVPVNKQTLSVYDPGEPVQIELSSVLGAGTSDLAGEDVQLVVLRTDREGANATSLAEDARGGQLESAMESEDAAAVTVLDDAAGVGALDGDGELSVEYTPSEAGTYTFALATVDEGTGLRVEDGLLAADGSVTVVGTDTALVHDRSSDVALADSAVRPSDEVPFDVEVDHDGAVRHTIVLYDEEQLVAQEATLTIAGETVNESEPSVDTTVGGITGPIAVGESIPDAEVPGSADEMAVPTDPVRLTDFLLSATVAPNEPDGTVLNLSARTLEGSSTERIEVPSGENWSAGEYRYVHVATAADGSTLETTDGSVQLTEAGDDGDRNDGDDGGRNDGDDGDRNDSDDESQNDGDDGNQNDGDDENQNDDRRESGGPGGGGVGPSDGDDESDTPTDAPTATATDAPTATDAAVTTATDEPRPTQTATDDEGTTGVFGPGFGPVAALLALLGSGLVALRRDR